MSALGQKQPLSITVDERLLTAISGHSGFDTEGLGPGNPQSIYVLGLGVGPHLRTPSASQSDNSPLGMSPRGAASYSSLGSSGQPVESGDT